MQRGCCGVVLAVIIVLLSFHAVAAQTSTTSTEAPQALALPKAVSDDRIAPMAARYARGLDSIFLTTQDLVSRLAPLPHYDSFRAEISPLRTEVRRFRATYQPFVCAEKPGSFGQLVLQAAQRLFTGIDAWEKEIRLASELEGATGSHEPLRARIDRDFAAQQRVADWNTAQKALDQASTLRPYALEQLHRAEAAQPIEQKRDREASNEETMTGLNVRSFSGYWLYVVESEDEFSDACQPLPDASRLTWKRGFARRSDCEAAGFQSAGVYECRPVSTGANDTARPATPPEQLAQMNPDWAAAVQLCVGAGQRVDKSFNAIVSAPNQVRMAGTAKARDAFSQCLTEEGQLHAPADIPIRRTN